MFDSGFVARRSAHNVVVPASVADFGSGWRQGIGKFRNLRQLTLRRAAVAYCLSATHWSDALSAVPAAGSQFQDSVCWQSRKYRRGSAMVS